MGLMQLTSCHLSLDGNAECNSKDYDLVNLEFQGAHVVAHLSFDGNAERNSKDYDLVNLEFHWACVVDHCG